MTIGVEISSVAKEKLISAGVSISEFKLELSETLSGSESYLFGRNVKNLKSELVWHIHFIPFNDPLKLKSWNDGYQHGRPSFNRVSDNIIFYVLNGAQRCMVIDFITPHGHSVFSNMDFIHNLETIATGYALHGIIP